MSGEIVSFGRYASASQRPGPAANVGWTATGATGAMDRSARESGIRERHAPALGHVEEVADAARSAGLAFLAGVRSGFDKRTLAAWLIGPYQCAVSFASSHASTRRRSSERAPSLRPAPVAVDIVMPPRSATPHVVRAEALEDVLHRARVQALAALEGASHSRNRPSFVQEAIARGHVASIDVGGVIGFFPQDVPHMRLRDRVLSLFAADYLARPAAYSRELLVCSWCESVRFDETGRARGMCSDHDRPSGIVNRTAEPFEDDEDRALRLPMRALIAG